MWIVRLLVAAVPVAPRTHDGYRRPQIVPHRPAPTRRARRADIRDEHPDIRVVPVRSPIMAIAPSVDVEPENHHARRPWQRREVPTHEEVGDTP